MTGVAAIARLHALADELAARGDGWLRECLGRAEAGEPLEQALGLHIGWRAAARARRDDAIRAIAAERFPDRSARTVAQIILRRPDLQAEIGGGHISLAVIRRALAHAPARNAPQPVRGSAHGNTRTAND